MRVVVTGASGFIGGRLCRALVSAGHEAVALVRDPARALRGRPELAAAHAWDAMHSHLPLAALDGADGVVNLAGEPVSGRWSAHKKAGIRDTRIVGTQHLVAAMADVGDRPSVLVSASAVGYYGDRGEEALSEAAPPGNGFLAKVCQEWEAAAGAAEGLGVRCVRVRIGLVLGREGGALPEMVPLFAKGLGGRLGSGRQWWPWIHVDDLVRLLLFALTNQSLAGPVNGTAPQPTRQAAFASALGRALHRPAMLWTPAPALRLALGGFASELLASRRVVPAVAAEAGFSHEWGSLDSALSSLFPA